MNEDICDYLLKTEPERERLIFIELFLLPDIAHEGSEPFELLLVIVQHQTTLVRPAPLRRCRRLI